MALKPTSPVPILCFALFVLCFALTRAVQDPELKQCQHQCKHQERFTETQKQQCLKTCEDYIRQKEHEQQQQQTQPPKKHLEEDDALEKHKWDPRKEKEERRREWDPKKECRALCKEEQTERAQRHCEDECEHGRRSRRWSDREVEGVNGKKKDKKTKEEGEEEEGEEENNPFVFDDEHFITKLETKEGRISVLRKFTGGLLRGVENFRIGVLEANPQTFIVPAHFDADCLLFVAKGRASVTLIRNKKQSFNLQPGDIFRVPAGSPVYLTNRDDNEELFIIKLLQPVALPGHFEAFYGPSGGNPESFYSAFSWDVLEAALNTGRERLSGLFGGKEQGGIVKASKQQIRALSPSFHKPGIWPFGSDSNGPFNLFNKRPTQSNAFGKLFEADNEDYSPLKDLDVMVSFADITKGAMITPFYNSRATKISFVVEGEGWLEMACPHISSAGEKEQGQSAYEKISAPLRKGTVFVAPAGHPLVTIASENKNLQILCFEVNAKGNIRFPLAGRNNIVSQMDSEAKALSFNMPAEEVDRVFRGQNEEFFFPGPKQGHESEHSSI